MRALLYRTLVCAAVAFTMAAPARAVQPDEMLPDPRLEQRARALSQHLRCMVCQNQSIDDSDAPLARDLRRIGAASLDLCFVAAGRLDGYFERGLNPWDHAAGALLVTEAGDSDMELAPGRYVEISIIDNGKGMAPEVLARACEPFYTTKPSGKGSGLGLSMVYGFAKQSGGSFAIESQVGRGTQVRLCFPAAERVLRAGEDAPDARVPMRRAKATILVVEDDNEVLTVAESFLQGAGYRVLTASGTEEALGWLLSQEPIDLLGPGYPGMEECRQFQCQAVKQQ